jgi:hypothetical protein
MIADAETYLQAAADGVPEVEAVDAETTEVGQALERELADTEAREPAGVGGGRGGGGGRGTSSRGTEGPEEGPGEIDESAKAFNPQERKVAELLESEGKHVKALKESEESGVKTPDAEVDGTPTEFKSLSPGARANTVKNQLNTAKRQARDAIVDARGTGLGEAEAREGLEKFLRANGRDRMDTIRIVGDGFDITFP